MRHEGFIEELGIHFEEYADYDGLSREERRELAQAVGHHLEHVAQWGLVEANVSAQVLRAGQVVRKAEASVERVGATFRVSFEGASWDFDDSGRHARWVDFPLENAEVLRIEGRPFSAWSRAS